MAKRNNFCPQEANKSNVPENVKGKAEKSAEQFFLAE